MRLIESSLLSGIPIFGYLAGAGAVQDIDLLSILKLYIASLFCALSVFSIGEAHSDKSQLKKSLIFLALSLFTTLTGKAILSFFPILIFTNWYIYYFVRMKFYFADIALHFAGGILQFFFGFYMSTNKIDSDGLLISLLPASAFTGGYITDLAEDVQEDRNIGQKNITEKIGINLTLILSILFFILAYIIAFLSVTKFKELISLFFLLHIAVFFIFFRNRNFMFYRNFYRLSFILIGLTWSAQKFL